MKIIGITGGIGSGKSLVLNRLKEKYNAHIVEADKVAHFLQMKGQPVYNSIVENFSSSVLNDDGDIDRQKLGKIVTDNKEKLEQLNKIVHPAVKEYILKDIEEAKKNGTGLYVIEAALLIQDGYKEICDELWCITADIKIRVKRLIENRGYSEEKAKAFIMNQPDEEFYIKNSDRVIYNDSDEGTLFLMIDKWYDTIK